MGALIMRIGFWRPLYYHHNKGPPKNRIGNYQGPYSNPLANELLVRQDGQLGSIRVYSGKLLRATGPSWV